MDSKGPLPISELHAAFSHMGNAMGSSAPTHHPKSSPATCDYREGRVRELQDLGGVHTKPFGSVPKAAVQSEHRGEGSPVWGRGGAGRVARDGDRGKVRGRFEEGFEDTDLCWEEKRIVGRPSLLGWGEGESFCRGEGAHASVCGMLMRR